MGRNSSREEMRNRIAEAAARIMAEDGVEDFALAKRKAARHLGAGNTQALPRNDEIESALRAYRALYQADQHPVQLAALRYAALDAMQALERFHPYLTGPVLTGVAGPHAAIDLQLFPENPKAVELYLLERRLAYSSVEARRYSGDRARAMTILTLDWDGIVLRLSVFDHRDERVALKTSPAGRVPDRAGIREVRTLLGIEHEPEKA
jgi:hypothetical protein